MIVSEFLTKLRDRISDSRGVNWKHNELVQYLNDSISFLGSELITMNDPGSINTVTITSTSKTVPSDYVRMAGKYPVYQSGLNFEILDGSTSVTLRYFATKQSVNSDSDTIPFNDIDINILIQLAAIYALNRDEYDTAQDERLVAELKQVVAVAKGGK